ncbi:hypothetical protein ACIOEZ_11620 [Streptomyces sp. NPDC087866]|uniref:hypothetical protein n=1 Tax=unclassified Streptomyces TaxID=2593676 RepID=UPI0033B67093
MTTRTRPSPEPARAARCFLVALLLAVLALVGAAPAATGAALPVRATAALPGTAATTAPGLPVRTPHPRGSAVPDTAPRSAAPAPAPEPPATAERGPHTTPWAAAEHPRTAHQLPPPGPGGLVSCPAGVPLPFLVPGSVGVAPASAVQRLRVALPGVRGPPSAGVHRPRDRFPVPYTINAVLLPLS